MNRVFAATCLATNTAIALTETQMHRFFDNRDPRAWTDPVEVKGRCAPDALRPTRLSN